MSAPVPEQPREAPPPAPRNGYDALVDELSLIADDTMNFTYRMGSHRERRLAVMKTVLRLFVERERQVKQLLIDLRKEDDAASRGRKP